MKHLLIAILAGCVGGMSLAGYAESMKVQDLGAALNPVDPTNGGFWSIDWTDDDGVRHVHDGVTVSRSSATSSTPLEASDLVMSLASDPGPLYFNFGLLIFVR